VTEAEAKQHLLKMLESFSPGSVLHVLAQVIRESEKARLGELGEAAEERVREAEAFLFVAGCGLMAALPR
jgi:hypothetical protein